MATFRGYSVISQHKLQRQRREIGVTCIVDSGDMKINVLASKCKTVMTAAMFRIVDVEDKLS